MAPALEIYGRLTDRSTLPAHAEGWAMYRLRYPTIVVSSQGGPWKTVAHRQGCANREVCVQVRGHDSNVGTLGLRLVSMTRPEAVSFDEQ